MFDLRFLQNLKQKLTTGNRGSIYLNALTGRYLGRLDVADLNWIQKDLTTHFLEVLTTKSSFKFNLTPNISYEHADEQRRLESIFKRLNILTIENNDHFSEHGVKNFGFGFPILLYRDKKDPTKIIKAPMFIWSLDIERNFQRANEWVIKRDEDFAITSNVVLAAYLHNDAAIKLTPIYDYFLSDAILDKDEIASLVAQQLHQLHPSRSTENDAFRTALDQAISPLLSRQQVDKYPLEEATVLWSGVFGLFKSQKESIINDLDFFMDNMGSLEQQLTIPTSALDLQHPFTAVNTDPSQQHILHQLQQGENLVIQGPPGTGKSQVLTGIISNIIANQGTCLIVCEKKTALDVIHQNLVDVGLGELSVIIEDIYRDRATVVNAIRERALQRHNAYAAQPSYLRLLEQYQTQITQLQAFHKAQFEPLLEDKSWTTLVNDFLEANEHYNKTALEATIATTSFQFNVEEYDSILSIIDQAKEYLAPLQKLAHPHDCLHDDFFIASANPAAIDKHQIEQTKLSIQRAILSGLRQNEQAQTLIQESQASYLEQLELHYQKVYQTKLQLARSLYQHSSHSLQKRIEQAINMNQAAQQMIQKITQQYEEDLENHFTQVHADKIGAVDQTAIQIKKVIYQALDETLQTIKEAQQDIMACLYSYEQKIETHLEAHYIQKMDLVDQMKATIKAGLANHGYFFKKPKGVFRAIMRGVSSKYKALEQEKQTVLKQYEALKKLHSKYKYFDISFKLNPLQSDFTFEAMLEFLEEYNEKADHWHRDQRVIIQHEVNRLSSHYSLEAVPYKKEAQTINQHLSDFRARILRNQLIQLEFKYKNLRLRNRYDQLDGIYEQVAAIKVNVDNFIHNNEQSWIVYNYPSPEHADNLKEAFLGMHSIHKQHKYFDFQFRNLGRPKLLEDYYALLEYLTHYRAAVETWYPQRAEFIQHYTENFHSKNLYQPLAFEQSVQTLEEHLDNFSSTYNQQQVFNLSFQLKGLLFSDQLVELKTLEAQLQQWKTAYEGFILAINEQYFDGHMPTIEVDKTSVIDQWKALEDFHHQYDYFDFKFDWYQQENDALQQDCIQKIAYYKQWTEQWYNSRQALIDNWANGLSPHFVCPQVPMQQEIATIHQKLYNYQENFNQLNCLKEPFEFPSTIIKEQFAVLVEQQKELILLQNSFKQFEQYYKLRSFWLQLTTVQQAAYKGLASLKDNDWKAAFTSWYFYTLLAHHAHQLPDKASYKATKQLLLEYETTLQKVLVNHSLHYWRSKQTIEVERFHQEKAPIKLHSLYNKRGHKGSKRTPLRKIIATDTALFTSFFPILLINPSVCSSILPLQPNLFDAIIFDEASQLRLEDTFCALIRGKHKIISGDSQQMAPSDYFQSSSLISQDIDETADETQQLINESIDFLTHSESLLEFALSEGSYRESFLEVHYRSKHPYLIDFSNAAFYSNRLSPLPSHEVYTPIEFFQVNGEYLDSENNDEAQAIIDYIIKLATAANQQTCPSVGIATFNIHQRNRILDLIQRRSYEGAADREVIQKLFLHGLFVKNLENIQGDERDVLIISTTYGPFQGSFIQNFGPINRQQGYRLLNVIVTRAKQKLCVFTSIPANYYENYRDLILEKGNVGRGIFYAYLAYAKAVSTGDEMTRQSILALLNDHSPPKIAQHALYQVQNNAFKLRVFKVLQQHYPQQIQLDYQYAGFRIPLLVSDTTGSPRLVLYFDTYHTAPSEEAYKWDLFLEQHLQNFGFQFDRIWSKDWWEDSVSAQENLLAKIASLG